MKNIFWLLVLSGLVVMLASSCSPTPTDELPAPEIIEEIDGSIPSADFAGFLHQNVTVVRNEGIPTTWDVFIQNPISSNMDYVTTINDFNENHYHNAETHNGNVYLIRRIGDPEKNEAWSDDLWRYGADGSAEMIFTQQGLDFRVSHDERFIAVSANGIVWFIDSNGAILAEFQQALQIMDTGKNIDGLVGWSADGEQFWLETSGPDLLFYGRVFSRDWQLKSYDVREVGMRRPECEVNANTGMVVFSDYPMFFAAFEQEAFEAEGRAVTLSIYDFEDDIKLDIAVSAAKKFDPVWLDDQTIEYDNPLEDGRITYSLR